MVSMLYHSSKGNHENHDATRIAAKLQEDRADHENGIVSRNQYRRVCFCFYLKTSY